MLMTHEHHEIQRTLKRFIDDEVNPHVDAWEAAEEFPAHQVLSGSAGSVCSVSRSRRSTAAWRSTTPTR